MRDRRGWGRGGLVVVTLALLVAVVPACSGGDDDGITAPPPTVAGAPSTTPGASAGGGRAATTAAAATTTSGATTGTGAGGATSTTTVPPTTAPAPTAADVARDLVAAETAIRDPASTPDQVAAAAHVQQSAYGTLLRHPDWVDAAVAAAPAGVLRDAVQRNLSAAQRLDAGTPAEAETPQWRIVAPEPPDQLLAHYHEAEARFGIPWTYLAAINLVETRMGRIVGLSTAGANGPMQFIPSTWDAYGLGGDVTDPRDAILGAANYLAASGGPADMTRALHAYNPSNAYVWAVTMYALTMADDPRAYDAYWNWGVRYRSASGVVELPVGWPEVPAAQVVFEVSERVLKEHGVRLGGVLDELAALGAGLVVDEYGTGYASLAYLRRFPIRGIKLARALLHGLTHDRRQTAVVSSLIETAHGMGLTVMVKGVETYEQAAALHTLGADLAQGPYFTPSAGLASRPRLTVVRDSPG